MPELPEVETVRRGLAPVMEGARVAAVEIRRPDLRFPFPERFAERIAGRTVRSLRRRAKYLLADLGVETLIMHLGMSGSFRSDATGDPAGLPIADDAFRYARARDALHDHVVFRLASGRSVTYNDPRRFGFMLLADVGDLERHPMLAGLGPEPLAGELDAEALAPRLAGRAAPLKQALLDQSLIAGLGNIYVCEALWRARLSPLRAAGTLVTRHGRPTARLRRLVEAIVAVIADALSAGGSSLRDYMRTDGTTGAFQDRFAVYDREGETCLRPSCRGTIARIVQSGRSTFFCPVCQN